jgi:outer membrane protein
VQAASLGDALALAYRQSNLLEQNRALLRAADEDVAIAVSALRPVIAFALNTSVARNETFNGLTNMTMRSTTLTKTLSLTGELTIYAGGANRLAIEAAKETVLATRQALLQVEQNVLLTAVQAYMEVIRASEFVALRQNNVRLITRELRAARDRFEVGEVTRTDVSIAEARLASARASLAAAQGDLEVAREAYKAAIGTYPTALRRPPAPPMTARSEAEAKAVAVRGHPLILQARHEVSAAELNVSRAEAALKPRVTGSLSGRVSDNDRLDITGGGGNSTDLSVGLALTQQIYQGGRIRATIRQAMAQRDAARSGLLQTTLGVEQEVGNAWARLAVALASLEASDRQVRASQVAYNGVREEASLGARTTLDVLNAEQELLDARAARISAETDQYVAIYSLLAAMGLLTVEHLRLGVPTYDPEAYYNSVRSAPTRGVSPEGEKLDRILERLGKD